MKVGGTKNPNAQPLEYILAVPGRRYAEFAELLQPIHRNVSMTLLHPAS
jgi:hypothetical protein